MKQAILNRIHQVGLLAVIRGEDASQAEKITDALVAGGVIGIEITFTTPDALAVVENLKKRYGSKILIGMGTLTRTKQAEDAKNAGASFLVSPHTEAELARAMKVTGLPFMMGALTPSEIMQAFRLGSDVVKVFPGSLFGPGYFKSLRGPYPDLKLMPTGGVNLENLEDWFAGGAYAVGVGSALFPKEWVAAGQFEDIRTRASLFRDRIEEIKSK